MADDKPKAELVPLRSTEVALRTDTLRELQRVVLALDDQRRELAAQGDYETLAAGTQDLEVLTGDLRDLLSATRRNIADIVDEKQGQRSEKGGYYYGINRIEVPGVGVVEVNGGWTRTKWRSEPLLRHLIEQAIGRCDEIVVNADGEPVELAESCVVSQIIETIKDTMPLTASLSWKVGQETADGKVTGLKKHGVDDTDWCERVPKERLATVPKHPLVERKRNG